MTQLFRFIILLAGFFSLHPAIRAQQTTQKFVQETAYLLSLPQGYDGDTTARWPLLIFLHGSGESGSDIEKVKAHGPPELVAKGKQFPMIIVSPQADAPRGWDADMLYRLLQDVKKRYRVNADKVYLTGLSMGGFGTFSLAIKYPDEFAAIAPVCGGGDSSQAWKLRNIATWVFHGAKDDVVLPAGSANMVAAEKRYNNDVRFTLYPDANHNSWDLTYNNDSLYSWMLSKTRFRYSEKPIAQEELKKLEGVYVAAGEDTVHILQEAGALIAKLPHERIPLRHSGNKVFFTDPGQAVELRFLTGKKGSSGFLFLGGTKTVYRKL